MILSKIHMIMQNFEQLIQEVVIEGPFIKTSMKTTSFGEGVYWVHIWHSKGRT